MLVLWIAVSFGFVFFARDLQFDVLGWPLSFWLAAQGIVLVFVCNRAEVSKSEALPPGQGTGL